MPDEATGAERTARPARVARGVLHLALGVVGSALLLLAADQPGDRLLIWVLLFVFAIGLNARSSTPDASAPSRLPAAAQGTIIGLALGVALVLVTFDLLGSRAPLVAFIALPPLYPAIVPSRWRRVVTLRWSDLTDLDRSS